MKYQSRKQRCRAAFDKFFWDLVSWLTVLVGLAIFANIPVAIFLVVKGFLHDPMGWIKFGFAGFVWVYLVTGFCNYGHSLLKRLTL